MRDKSKRRFISGLGAAVFAYALVKLVGELMVVFSGAVSELDFLVAVDLRFDLIEVSLALVFGELDDVLLTGWALLPVNQPLSEAVHVEYVVADWNLH